MKTKSSYWLESPLSQDLEPCSCISLSSTNKSKSEEILGVFNWTWGKWQLLYLPIQCVGSQDDLDGFRQWLSTGWGSPQMCDWRWATSHSFKWVRCWASAVVVFHPGQSHMSRQLLQTDFLIVLPNCTRGKGNAGDWEDFLPRKTQIQAHWLGINSSMIWRLEQIKDQS